MNKAESYPVVYEACATGYGAYPIDIPGVGITAPTLPLARLAIAKAIRMQLAAYDEMNIPHPIPSIAETVCVEYESIQNAA